MMKIMKNHQKVMAIISIFLFACLLAIASHPLTAGTCKQKNSDAAINQTSNDRPGAVEKVAAAGNLATKKSLLLPILIGVVMVSAVAAVLILVVLKTKYDIRSNWDFEMTYTVGGEKIMWGYLYCQGSLETGLTIFTYTTTTDWEGSGTYYGSYQVDGNKVHLDLSGGLVATGQFDDRVSMSGQWGHAGGNGYWTASKK